MSPRSPKFRFYLDENFPSPAGQFLSSLGHNVAKAVDSKQLRSLSDLKQLKIANKLDRIFVALDKDFRTNQSLKGEISTGKGVILIESADPS